MKPLNINNLTFKLENYKNIFKPLIKLNFDDYNFIINIITKGADIKRTTTSPPKSNPNYPISNPYLIRKVTEKFIHHLKLGHLEGPHPLDNLPSFDHPIHTSPIACKLKSSGKAMMLIDESSPKDHNINSEIEKQYKHVQYISFEDLCELLKRIGNNGWIWVIDAVDAYYRIPIDKKFHHLFGVIWLEKLIIFKCLSFGLSTAPAIYNKFADLILWACTYHRKNIFSSLKFKKLFNILHYLDDFFGGSKNKKRAILQMNYLQWLFKHLNIPTNPSKVVGPTQATDILGWACRTSPTVQIGISESKRIKYLKFLKIILSTFKINFFQSEKIIGYLRHTCKVYLLGNKFIRGIEKQKFSLQHRIKKKFITKFYTEKLSNETKFDLDIWANLLSDVKCRYLDIDFILKPDTLNKITVWTDASTSYGAGGCSSLKNLYHLPWNSLILNKNNIFNNDYSKHWRDHIIYLELLALVTHAYLFSRSWKNSHITFTVITQQL